MYTFGVEKLVRDRYVTEAESLGGTVKSSFVSGADMVGAIDAKIPEELKEVAKAASPVETALETADVIELLLARAALSGADEQMVMEALRNKRGVHGGYEEGLYAHTITVPPRYPYLKHFLANPDRYPQLEPHS